MKVTREFCGRLLTAYCDSDLEEHADILLRMVEEADEPVGGLRDGTIIEFGWAPLRLHAEHEDLVVCEPDYAGDVNQFVSSVSRTLRVAAEQTALLNALGIVPAAARYDRGVVLKRGVLDLDRIYAHRRQSVSERDSGWYIGSAEDVGEAPDPGQLEAIYVYRLLNVRPALLRVMALPPEYIVVFDGDDIEAVVDPLNRRVWPLSPESTPATNPLGIRLGEVGGDQYRVLGHCRPMGTGAAGGFVSSTKSGTPGTKSLARRSQRPCATEQTR